MSDVVARHHESDRFRIRGRVAVAVVGVGLRDFAARSRYDRRIQLTGDYHAQNSVNASFAAGEVAAARVTELLRTIY